MIVLRFIGYALGFLMVACVSVGVALGWYARRLAEAARGSGLAAPPDHGGASPPSPAPSSRPGGPVWEEARRVVKGGARCGGHAGSAAAAIPCVDTPQNGEIVAQPRRVSLTIGPHVMDWSGFGRVH